MKNIQLSAITLMIMLLIISSAAPAAAAASPTPTPAPSSSPAETSAKPATATPSPKAEVGTPGILVPSQNITPTLPEAAATPGLPQVPPKESFDDSLVRKSSGSPVTIDGKVIFYLRRGSDELPVERRAKVVSNELTLLAVSSEANLDDMRTEYNEKYKYCDITYKSVFLFRIYPEDVPIDNFSTLAMAQKIIQYVKLAKKEFVARQRVERIRTGTMLALKGLGIIIIVTVALIVLTRWLKKRIEANKIQAMQALKIKEVEILSRSASIHIFFLAYTFVIIALYLIFLDLYGGYVLSYFPDTEWIRATLCDFPRMRLKEFGIKMIGYIPNVIFIIICVYLTRFALGINDKIFQSIEKGMLKTSSSYYEFREIFQKISRLAIYFFAAILIIPNLPGYDLPIFKGLSIVVALMVSLGSSSIMSSQMAGISLIISRAYKVGDRVKIGEHVGDVMELNLPYTRLRTLTQTDVVISNSTIIQKEIINYSSPVADQGSTVITSTITIGYDAPGDVVTELCQKAADATDNVLKSPAPVVFQKSLDDFYVTYEIFAYTDRPYDMLITNSNLNTNIRDFFDKAGVEIMSPHYSAFRNGNKTTIPERHLNK